MDNRDCSIELENIIRDLAEMFEMSDSERKEEVERLIDVYSNKGFRHSYYELSLLLDEYAPDVQDTLVDHLVKILEEAEKCYGEARKDEVGSIRKLSDHISLESLRISRMRRVQYIGDQAASDLKKANFELANSQEQVESLKSQVQHFHTQSITILGIFSGLVIGISTGAQLLTESFSHISEINIYKMVLYISVISLFLFNIIFMLMYTISKISDKSISVNCRNKKCEGCSENHKIVNRVRIKYPYVFYFDLTGLLLCLVLCTLNMLNLQ